MNAPNVLHLRRRVCPPCPGDCDQGRTCPARLSQATAKARAEEAVRAALSADRTRRVLDDAMVSTLPTWAVILIFALAVPLSALITHLLAGRA